MKRQQLCDVVAVSSELFAFPECPRRAGESWGSSIGPQSCSPRDSDCSTSALFLLSLPFVILLCSILRHPRDVFVRTNVLVVMSGLLAYHGSHEHVLPFYEIDRASGEGVGISSAGVIFSSLGFSGCASGGVVLSKVGF